MKKFYNLNILDIVHDMYSINKDGDIKNNITNHILKPWIDKDGYCNIGLKVYTKKNKRRFRCHILVALMFIPNVNSKPTVNHKNGKKKDNCYDNLEWATHKEQTRHATETGLKKDSGENHYCCKYSDKLVRQICIMMQNGKSNKKICKYLNKNEDSKFKKFVNHLRKKTNRKQICDDYMYTKSTKGGRLEDVDKIVYITRSK